MAARDINFIYLLVPTKRAFYDVTFAPGYSSDIQQRYNELVEAINDGGVETIDMNTWFQENGWSMDDVYFKTDHHWVPQAALAAANVTMERLSNDGLVEYDKDLLKTSSYTITTLKNWFLGSHGKRVGTFYAGVDDISVYFPNFTTWYTYSGLSSGTTNWSYSDTLLNLSYLNNKDYFGSDPNCIYLYGEYPLQVVTNSEAINDKKVLITGDSYRRSWEYFLSSQFQEIYSIDLRYYTDGTLAQYIEEIQPDIVIMCTDNLESELIYNFGISEYIDSLNDTDATGDIIDISEAKIKAQDNNNNFSMLYEELEPGQTYTITVGSTSYSGGNDLYIQMTLQNLSTNEAIYNRYFDANSNDLQKWIFTTLEDDSSVYAIYLYAGTKGDTDSVNVCVTDIKIHYTFGNY